MAWWYLRLDSARAGKPMAVAASICRMRVCIAGTVQGVGFRPFVYRLAGELALAGWVRNDERGVEVEVEGATGAVEAFLARLPLEAPPMARVECVRAEPQPVRGERRFLIAPSARTGGADALVAPDAATCSDCLAELLDPGDRRYRYPFINCTNCGPRFTIVRGVPYDRPLTTMAGFAMCAACRAEYEDPADRRFHAQPNACPVCGPCARLLAAGTEVRDGTARLLATETEVRDAIAGAAWLLAEGAVVAVKGLGGYHLTCRADDEAAVGALRARKQREDRPFALMVADLAAARQLVCLQDEEAALLEGPARPIVLATRRTDAPVAPAVAAGAPELGLMLPYTPLHHLLLADVGALGGGALVMTSGNVSDEPIAYEDEEALARLAPIADAFLLHDRPIHMRTDDSVVRAVRVGARRRALPLRRSRGYVPASLRLPVGARRPLLACGAELKSTFCVARGERAWVSHHIGDLRNWETLRSFREGIAHFEELFAVAPEVVVHDLHPDYLSTAYAMDREQQGLRGCEHRMVSCSPRNPGVERLGIELLAVQHHHAHLAAVLAEHGETGPAVGAIYDGAGYGTDGTVWGGELLVGGLAGCRARGPPAPRPSARRGPSGTGAVADGLRVAGGGDGGSGAADPTVTVRPRRPRPVGRRSADRPGRRGGPDHHQRGAPVRRGRRAVRSALRGDLRGPGGDRAGSRGRPGRAWLVCDPVGGRAARPAPGDRCRECRSCRGRLPGDGLSSVSQRAERRNGACLRGDRRARPVCPSSSWPAASFRIGSCSRGWPLVCRPLACTFSLPSAYPPTTVRSLTARRRSPQ